MVTSVVAPLFVPATKPDHFAKAAASGADAVILDLEDAVASSDKDAARAALDASFTSLPVFVRVNASGTSWHDADLSALRGRGFAAVLLPKAEDTAIVAQVVATLSGLPVIALVESTLGLANARTIAALDGVARLAFGSVDFCADLGCAHEREILLPARSELVLASRIARIAPPIDGVTVQLDDPAIAQGDAAHARALGMTGKFTIHPKQVGVIKDAFAPSETEIVWANRVLASGDGAVSVDGAMVDEPVRIRARSILAAVRKAQA
jgi:citrate lyase subunit beta/citryl-CoA lyase